MKRNALIMMFLGILIMVIGLPSAFAQVPEPGREGWHPFEWDVFNDCANEVLHFSGVMSFGFVGFNDPSGGFHEKYIFNYRGTAVGLTSGNAYRYKAVDECVIYWPEQVTVDPCAGSWHLISLGRNVPDLKVHNFFNIVISASGSLEMIIDKAWVTCR